MFYIFLIYGLILGFLRATENAAAEKSINSGEHNTDIELINGKAFNVESPAENQVDVEIINETDEDPDEINETATDKSSAESASINKPNERMTNGKPNDRTTFMEKVLNEIYTQARDDEDTEETTLNSLTEDDENLLPVNDTYFEFTDGNEYDEEVSDVDELLGELLLALNRFTNKSDFQTTTMLNYNGEDMIDESLFVEEDTVEIVFNESYDYGEGLSSSTMKTEMDNIDKNATGNSTNINTKDGSAGSLLNIRYVIEAYLNELVGCSASSVNTYKLLNIPNGAVEIIKLVSKEKRLSSP